MPRFTAAAVSLHAALSIHSSLRPAAMDTASSSDLEDACDLSTPTVPFKLLVLGPSGAGKTSLVVRACSGLTPVCPYATVVADNFLYFTRAADQRVRLDLWDTAGQERFGPLVPLYYRGASGVVAVFDVTQRASFVAAQEWILRLQGTEAVNVGLLLGNKVDLLREPGCPREVTRDEAEAYAKGKGFLYTEVSAMTGEQVDAALQMLAEELLQKAEPARRRGAAGGTAVSHWQPRGSEFRLKTIPEAARVAQPGKQRRQRKKSTERDCCSIV